MKKIVFGSICMLTGVMGIIAMIFAALYGSRVFGSINGSTNILTYFNWYGITPFFVIFCLLGVLGFVIGIWSVLENK